MEDLEKTTIVTQTVDPAVRDIPYQDSPLMRYWAWQKRDKKVYCMLHPHIHPDNAEKIKLKDGESSLKGQVHTFKYCPKCFAQYNNL